MNKIFVVSGPSGSGKTTLIRMLTEKYSDLHFSISHTTRKMREGEADGREYYFISRKEFRKMVRRDEFAEWAGVHDELYGTSIHEIRSKSDGEMVLVLDIDVQGAEIIREKFPEALLVFIKPPGLSELKQRIQKREKELTADFKKRIRTAETEMERSRIYDHIVINDQLDQAFDELERIFLEYRNSFGRRDEIKGTGGRK